MDSLSFTTAGSVDNGKSTLIGRLLLDSHALPEDQQPTTDANGAPLAWVTDGLKEERAQGITIDVAYRYFGTGRRRFTVADAPGHFEYTRNMVTAASTSQLAVVLVDAVDGLTEQTHRHAYLSSLLGLRALALCVNKMDLVGWSPSVYDGISEQFRAFAAQLDFDEVRTFPISALLGDNVTAPSERTPWYRGPTLLSYLETTRVAESQRSLPFRFFVQATGAATEGPLAAVDYALGRVVAGVVAGGDAVQVEPGRAPARIADIRTMDGPLEGAFAPQSVALRLEGGPPPRRGQLLAAPAAPPRIADHFDATLCWMSATGVLEPGATYEVRHGTRAVPATVTAVHQVIDVTTGVGHPPAARVAVNDIATVSVRVEEQLVFDAYGDVRGTGSFILVDPASHESVAAGMIKRTFPAR